MSPRLTACAALLFVVPALGACGGGDDAGGDALASAEALADELSDLASQEPAEGVAPSAPVADDTAAPAEDPAAAGGLTDEEIGDVVCTSLAEIAADIAAGNAEPVMIQGSFTIGTLAASDETIANAGQISERADAVAQEQCPEDLATVLAAVGLDSLKAVYEEPVL